LIAGGGRLFLQLLLLLLLLQLLVAILTALKLKLLDLRLLLHLRGCPSGGAWLLWFICLAACAPHFPALTTRPKGLLRAQSAIIAR